jgi:hypothetical protein
MQDLRRRLLVKSAPPVPPYDCMLGHAFVLKLETLNGYSMDSNIFTYPEMKKKSNSVLGVFLIQGSTWTIFPDTVHPLAKLIKMKLVCFYLKYRRSILSP